MIGPKTTLTFKQVTRTDDGMGGFIDTWIKNRNITGVLAILSDRERIMYGKKAEAAQYKFVMDYQFASEVQTQDRFYLDTRVFEIISRELPLNQTRFLVFLLSEKVNG